jgi:hypothetical protein
MTTSTRIKGVYFANAEEGYTVGTGGVTYIAKTEKAGMYCNIPYISVYKGDQLLAEMCQHNVEVVVFTLPDDEPLGTQEVLPFVLPASEPGSVENP